jgi:hypothetical protein
MDLNTTMRYVHLNDEDVRAAMEKARGGHNNGHSRDLTDSGEQDKTLRTATAIKN